MKNRSSKSLHERLRPKDLLPFLIVSLILTVGSARASAQVVLGLGDILVAEPGTASISVIDPATGTRTVIAQGDLLSPPNKAVGVALATDGDVIVVSRLSGLIRVNPENGDQEILSQGGLFRDPWAIAINKNTGDIYVADSGYDNDRPAINEAGKIIRVNPVTGAQELIAVGNPCVLFPPNVACQNTTSAGSYLSHPYGIALDYSTSPATIIVSDMSSFNGKGAIFRIQPFPNGTQTLLWGPASASPAPEVAQAPPLGCPMGIEVEPNGNILTTVFVYPVPPSPTIPPPSGTFYGCAPPGIYRVDLINNVQTVLNANAPLWQSTHSYDVGDVVFDDAASTPHVHRVVAAGTSQGSPPAWNGAIGGTTTDGPNLVWQNIGLGANWRIPFGVNVEPAPTPSDPSNYNIIVGDEGYSMVFRLGANGAFIPPAPLTTGTSNITSVDVIDFAPGGSGTPPVRSNGQPVGTLPFNTTQTTISLATNENATCRFSLTADVPYGSMTNTFTTTGGTTHSSAVNGLANGGSYTFYVRCVDAQANANTNDFIIAFSVAATPGTTSNFAGTETPLSENGVWDSPGTWADLQKNNGAFAVGLNAQGRLVTPAVAADQFSEITYDQNPGANSWVGVTTRTQGAGNGSGYLAIAFNGEVQLYRTDDSGSLSFTLLASAPASLGTPPMRLRLESQGNNHRVYFNGNLMIDHAAGAPLYSNGQPGIAASTFGGPQVKILSFTGGDLGGSLPDTTPPVRSNGQPAGVLPWNTTQTTIGLTTDENATCRFSITAGVPYGSMTNTFTTTGGTTHSTIVTGLSNGGSYSFFVRCVDTQTNVNSDDFAIAFSVANSLAATSNFTGTETPLSENGVWDSPGAWADLQKNNGAFAVGLNSQGRLVTPAMTADQYSEITYDQNPGANSWVGVTTRTQGAGNGSGYLAIAFNGEVQLYRTDDSGSLSFALLASAPASLGTPPMRLRLESQGNNHRVYFNGNLMIDHAAGAPLYSNGQPGIAASTFGGPQVKILSFEGGDLTTGPVPSLTISDVSVTEGNTGSVVATLTVSLSSASTQSISVDYATANGTATAGSDYTAGAGTLTFAPGQTSQPITLSVTGDTLDEVNETFTVNLSVPSNATIQDEQGVVTILDDDPAPTISITDVTVPEGNSGSANAVLTVSLSVASGQTVTVAYATANGTATAGSDYTSGADTLTFAPGEISKLVTIAITGDVADEVNETFTVNLTAPSNATILDGQGIVTITDDDGLPSISVADISVVEGNSGTKVATFTLTLSAPSGSPVTVRFATANGTASSSSDYVARPTTTTTFTSGTTSVPVTVTINGDTLHEADETFVLNLTVPTNATIADPQATATIANDDAPGSLSIGNRTVTEGNTGSVNASFTVTLSPSSGTTVTVAYATANGTASAGTDYVATTGTLSFSPGATSRTITVPVNGDLLDEANETFFVNLSLPGNATIGDGEGLGTINDNDAMPSISIADLSVLEGNSGTSLASFTLTLSAVSGRQVSVAYATANGVATAGSDFVAAAGTAIFPIGTTSVPVEVTINGDTATEANEGFVVGLSGAINATIARAQATGVILNDDGGIPQPTGLMAAYGFEEGFGATTADASGGGQTGAISGATWATDGKTGHALAFDGVNDMVTIDDNARLDVTRITMMAWVRPTALSGWRTVLLKERPFGLAYGLYADNDAERPAGHIFTGLLESSSEGTAPLPLNAWTHLASTFDGSRLKLYVNGVLVRNRSVGGSITVSGMPLRIGGNEVWGEWFAGLIDDVRIYNRALSQTEIAVDMNTPVTP